jgi:hypothetical protein
MKGKIIVQNFTGVDYKTASQDITIFPNPSEGIFQIDIGNTDDQQIYKLSIYDISGASIYLASTLLPHDCIVW